MAPGTHATRFASFAQFYPFYLGEHRNATCRRLHFIGSLGVIGCVARGIGTGSWILVPVALVCGSGVAWVCTLFF